MDIHTIIIVGFYLVILLYSIILHEIAHGIVALRLGDRTAQLAGRLTLNPRSHIDPIGSLLVPAGILVLSGFRFAFGWARPVPFNPNNLRDPQWGPVLVALGGPVTNFIIALVAALVAKVLPVATVTKSVIVMAVFRSDWSILAQTIAGSLTTILFLFCIIAIFWNVLLGVFNLLPIPPLDGSKILYALVPLSRETQMALERYGFFILVAVVFLFPQPLNFLLQLGWGIFFAIAQ